MCGKVCVCSWAASSHSVPNSSILHLARPSYCRSFCACLRMCCCLSLVPLGHPYFSLFAAISCLPIQLVMPQRALLLLWFLSILIFTSLAAHNHLLRPPSFFITSRLLHIYYLSFPFTNLTPSLPSLIPSSLPSLVLLDSLDFDLLRFRVLPLGNFNRQQSIL